MNVTNAGNVSVTGAVSFDGNATLASTGTETDVTVSNLISRNNTTVGTLNIDATRNVIFNGGGGVNATGAGGALAVTLNADTNGASGGAIQVGDGTTLSTITSNGGSITLGGSGSPTSTAAIGVGALVEGVKLNNAQLVSGAGTISIRGTGLAGTTNAYGVSLANGASVTSTSGPITVIGTGGNGTGADRGIYLSAGSSVASGTGLITLAGTGSGIGASNNGVELSASSVNSTGSAAIQITGTGAAGGNDIRVTTGTSTIGGNSAVGDILLNGTTTGGMVLGTGGDTTTVQTAGNITLNQTGGGVSQGSGSLLANGLRLLGSGAFSLNQASNNINVLVANLTGAATTLSYRDADGFSIGTGTGGLSTVQTAGGGVTGPTLGITVGTAGTAANTLTLNAYGAVTQATAADNVTAGGLQLLGNGPFTLNNAGNDVTTLAANVAGNVSYRDANSFTVGVVADAPSAVSTTGITTTAGGSVTLDNAGVLTIAQNVSTDGAFAQISSAGTGTVLIASPRSISTTSDAVSFASPVTLNGGASGSGEH